MTIALSACAPPTPAPPAAVRLDCAQGYDALSKAIGDLPGVVAAPQGPGEPYRVFNAADGSSSYFVTQPGAPGHPAILKQEATRQDGRLAMRNTGCAYGDQAGYDQLTAYLENLSRLAKAHAR